MASFFVENMTLDFLFMRQCANPIDAKEIKQIISGDVVKR